MTSESELTHLLAKLNKDKALRWMYRRAWEMGGQGFTVSEIAREFGVAKSSVRLWMNQIRFEPRVRILILGDTNVVNAEISSEVETKAKSVCE
jgi:transposase-like protein